MTSSSRSLLSAPVYKSHSKTVRSNEVLSKERMRQKAAAGQSPNGIKLREKNENPNSKTKLTQQDLRIDSKYESLVPRPSPEEYQALKNSIEKEGQRDKITVNGEGTVLDGCTRFRILKELKREIRFDVRTFENKREEEFFVRGAATNRRNLTKFQKIKLVYAELEIERKEARKRRSSGLKTLASREAKVGKASKSVANRHGIPVSTFEKGVFILEHDPSEDVLLKLENEELTITEVYNQLNTRSKEKNTSRGEDQPIISDMNAEDSPGMNPDNPFSRKEEDEVTRSTPNSSRESISGSMKSSAKIPGKLERECPRCHNEFRVSEMTEICPDCLKLLLSLERASNNPSPP